MRQPKANSRPVSPLSTKLERRLSTYVAVASAAGLGMMGAPQLIQAEVVYTATNVSIEGHGNIDLNNDGIPDFEILARECGSHSECLDVNPLVKGNGIRGGAKAGSFIPAEFFGVPIGAGEKFVTGDGTAAYGNLMAIAGGYGPYSWSNGPWKNVTNRYLGFRFLINGQAHYGWARLNVEWKSGNITLTGYAYETVANQTIIAGHTSGPSVAELSPELSPVSQPATLGVLARGSDGLDLWRRDDETPQAA